MPAEEGAGKASTTTAWRRWSIYGLLMGDILALKIPRLSIPSMVPFIVAELGLPQSSVPALLSAFHPGYVASNLPGGPLVQRFGAKMVGLVGIAGTAALFGLMSGVGIARTRASSLLMALMLVMGLLQGPLSPVLMQTNQQWIPSATAADKVERTWSIRLQSLMHSFAPALSVAITPRLAARFNWKTVCKIYAGGTFGYAVLWTVAFADSPPRSLADRVDTEPVTQKQERKQQQEPEQKTTVEWGILRLPHSLTLIAYHVAFDNLETTLFQLAPTMFVEKFGMSVVQMSSFVGVAQMVHVPAGFAVSALESLLIKRRVDTLTVRRTFTCLASVLEASCAIAYALAKTPLQAAICYGLSDCCSQLHGSGAWTSFMEHGGKDAATLNSVSNTLASLTGVRQHIAVQHSRKPHTCDCCAAQQSRLRTWASGCVQKLGPGHHNCSSLPHSRY
jgi:sugar phosphate permease